MQRNMARGDKGSLIGCLPFLWTLLIGCRFSNHGLNFSWAEASPETAPPSSLYLALGILFPPCLYKQGTFLDTCEAFLAPNGFGVSSLGSTLASSFIHIPDITGWPGLASGAVMRLFLVYSITDKVC